MNARQLSLFDDTSLKGKLEALLFAAGEPVAYRDLMHVIECDCKSLRAALDLLSEEYDRNGRGIQLLRMENSCQLATKPEFYPEIKLLLGLHQRSPLSKAAMETLAIVAYRQPITRVEIEMIRGVSSSKSIQSLLDKGMIMEAGRKEATGRPFLYRTTDEFLKAVNIRALSELPDYHAFVSDFESREGSEFELSD